VFRRRIWLMGLLLPLLGGLGYWRYYQWREHRFDAVIVAAARRYGVDPALVKAVVWRESRFNPDAHGRKGEIGLMQIRAAAAKEWAQAERIVTLSNHQLADPTTNALVGTWYIGKLLRRYQKADQPVTYALADYNAGRSNVLRWNKGTAETNGAAFLQQMDFPGTRDHVRSVISRYQYYGSFFPPKEP